MQNEEAKPIRANLSRREFVQLSAGMLAAGLIVRSHVLAAGERSSLALSDVFFSQPHYDFFRTGIYEPYGVDWTAWGFLPLIRGRTNMAGYHRAIERHREAGIGFQARVEWDAVRNGMPVFAPENDEAAIRDLAGEIITVPWFAGETWFCSHQPLFQAYLRYQIDLALSDADEGRAPDALMFDCQTATPLTYHYGGCFCDRCLEDFHGWLLVQKARGRSLSDESVDLAAFDYREHLRARGYTVEDYNESVKRWPNFIPFSEEYRLFQLQYLQTLIQQFIDYAREQVGDSLAFSTSAPLTHAPRLVHNEAFSHYTLEANHHADQRAPADVMFTHYKLADAIKRPLVLTALPNPDWLTMALEGRPNLARSWIAQAYASGALFMVPIEQWAYRGTGHLWYRSRPGEYAAVYQFIQRQSALFNEYEPVAQIALLYVHAAFRRNSQTLHAAVRTLTRASVPFRLFIAGDEWWPYPESVSATDNFVRLLTTTDVVRVDEAQRDFLVSLGERAQSLVDFRNSADWNDWRIRMSAPSIIALPRQRLGEASASAVCHLLNRNYSATDERFSPPGEFTVKIPRNIYGNVFGRATLHAPGADSQTLRVTNDSEITEILVPNLNYWAVLELR